MKIRFRNRRLEKYYQNSSKAVQAFGDVVARRYVLRINMIKAANNIEELGKLPGLKYHPLKGDRLGQHAVSLTGFMRLIFTIEGDELNVAMIEEVSKHYDD